MQNELKQSGARGIGLFSRHHDLSLFKLTAAYAGILAIILLISSSITYSIFSARIGHRFERMRPPVVINSPGGTTVVTQADFGIMLRAQDVRNDLINTLLLVNLQLLVLAIVASYFLAKFTLRPLKETYERQQRFLGDASHELRTPLAILHADLENELAGIKGKDSSERAKSHLEEVKRMSSLVTDLLTLSRLDEAAESINTKKHLSSVNINDLVGKTTERLKQLAEKNDVNLTFRRPLTNEEIIITSNEEQIALALTNIIRNAILYNKKNGNVVVSVTNDARTVTINVTDTGIGISEGDLRMIFDRFYRVSKSRSRLSGGSGLGLSIVKSSIESLGGSVEIISELEKGTEVIINLPRK